VEIQEGEQERLHWVGVLPNEDGRLRDPAATRVDGDQQEVAAAAEEGETIHPPLRDVSGCFVGLHCGGVGHVGWRWKDCA
jgi:hypothetical protein